MGFRPPTVNGSRTAGPACSTVTYGRSAPSVWSKNPAWVLYSHKQKASLRDGGRPALIPTTPRNHAMGNTFKTAALLGLLSGLLLFIGGSVGGQQGLVIAFIFALAMNFGSYWFSDKIVLKMYKAQEVGPEQPLHQMVERLSRRAGLPTPKVYVIPTEAPNAFATGRNPEHAAVAATAGIMRLLSREELEGVIAHELAHVKNRDILIASIAATIAATIMMLASIARWGMIFGGRGGGRDGGNAIALLATAIVAPLAAMIIQAAVPCRRQGRLGHRRWPRWPGPGASKDRGGGETPPAPRKPRHRAPVHREAVFGRGADVAF